MPRPAGEHPQAPLADRLAPLPTAASTATTSSRPGDAEAEHPGDSADGGRSRLSTR